MADTPNTQQDGTQNINLSDLVGPQLDRLQKGALVAGVVGVAAMVLGAILDPADFFISYLFAFMFWLGVTTGSLGWLMIGHVTGGGWAFILRRPLEAATRNLPLAFAMFVPILFGMGALYGGHHGWNRPYEELDTILRHKNAYLNVPFFIARAVFYFVVWGTLAFFLNKWSRIHDERDDPAVAVRLNNWSAGGLLIFVLTMTFAAFDWMMSLEPHWFSSLFGVIIIVGQGLSTLALMTILIARLAGHTPFLQSLQEANPRYFRDLGNLTLAFTLLWAYTNFSQYMIYWSGNIAEEVEWFVHRARGGWGIVSMFLIVAHFALPFLVLLSSTVKVKINNLAKLAVFILFMRFVDLWWYITPTFRHELTLHWLDIACPIGLGGIWLWAWARELKGRLAVPVYDPRLRDDWPLKLEGVAHHG